MLTDVAVAKLKYKALASNGEKRSGSLLLNRIPGRDGVYI